MDSLDKLTIKGFRSIRNLEDFELKNLNIFIGGNGAGKSNMIGFFALLKNIMNNNLSSFIRINGGIEDILHNGLKETKEIFFSTTFGKRGYRFTLLPTPQNRCIIDKEACFYESEKNQWQNLGSNYDDSSLLVKKAKSNEKDNEYSKLVHNSISSWQIYHFHDTGEASGMRRYEIIQDKEYLRSDASNIAPFLYYLKENHKTEYDEILNSIRLVMPFFEDFNLRITNFGDAQKINLSWFQKGSDYPMQPYHLSDGSIRFICLAAALLQPNPPRAIIIDEPELGLHPAAISILAELLQNTAKRTQVIVATQSPALIDNFEVEDIIVVKQKNGESIFERLNEEEFAVWLENYTPGELWVKNVIAGGPVYE